MEDEARDILRVALARQPERTQTLVEAIRARIEPLGGVDLDLPLREPIREPQDLDERQESDKKGVRYDYQPSIKSRSIQRIDLINIIFDSLGRIPKINC